MSADHLPVIFLMGPTASGKTAAATQLAREFPIDIISVDSAMIYKGMDIGTGKPSKKELAEIPQHLIDIRQPNETYSAAEFREDALKLITDIHARGKIPLLVGGTMLYFHALKYGMSSLPSGDPKIRAQLQHERATLGLEKLYERLQQIDPESAKRINPNDPQRLLRALEVYALTGKSLSEHFLEQTHQPFPYKLFEFALSHTARETLHHHIADRFEKMLHQGFVAEVAALQQRGDLNLSMSSIRSVGYRQIWQYLLGEYDESTMKEKVLAATRQLAKRQLTWLRSWENVKWCDAQTILTELIKVIKTHEL